MKRHKLRGVTFKEFSAVDVPAHEGAVPAIRKSRTLISIETPQETPTMTTADQALATVTAERDALKGQVGDLTKSLADGKALLAKALALNSTDLGYLVGLRDDAERVQFLGKSASERAAIVKAADDADPVEVTLANGTQVRKSAGPVAVGMARENVMLAKKLADQEAAAEVVALEKRAGTLLGNVTGEAAGRVALVKAVSLLPEAERPAAEAVLKTCNDSFAQVFRRAGSGANPSPESGGDPNAKLEAMAKSLATVKNIGFYEAYSNLTSPGHADYSEEAGQLLLAASPGNR